MSPRSSLCLVLLALVLTLATAQDPYNPDPNSYVYTTTYTRPPTPTTGTPRDSYVTSISPSQCTLQPTYELLGYEVGSGRAIFQNRCSGSCVYSPRAPSECLPTTRDVSVTQSVNSYNPYASTTTVKLVVSCNCRARQCQVNIGGSTQTYDHDADVMDSCDRRCKCRYGVLTECCRQRKEWRLGMTAVERQRYIQAVRTVSAVGSPQKAQFDALIQKHFNNFNAGIHNAPMFLPWHRAYIWELEDLLQQVDCRVTVPYWRWSLEAANPFSSTVWADSNEGFGGNGSPGGSCVATGPFQTPGWQTSQIPPVCLRRNFNPFTSLATEAHITQTLNVDCPNPADFQCMSNDITDYHDSFHVAVGGQMGGGYSSNDPIFFLHHCFVDRIWARWQSKSAAHVTAYSANPNAAMPGYTSRPADWFDLNAQGGNAANRVCYIDPPNSWVIDTVLNPNPVPTNPCSYCGTTNTYDTYATPNTDYTNPNYVPPVGYGPPVPANPCITPQYIRRIPRTPIYPPPYDFVRAMGGMDPVALNTTLTAMRVRYDGRNNGNTYNLIRRDVVATGGGDAAYLGIYLYDANFGCLSTPSYAPVVETCNPVAQVRPLFDYQVNRTSYTPVNSYVVPVDAYIPYPVDSSVPPPTYVPPTYVPPPYVPPRPTNNGTY